jgi:steroid delta-isomerase
MSSLGRFREFYDTFGPAWLDRLPELYAPDFDFADPFHAIRGDMAALRGYFERVLKLPVTRFITEDDATGSDGSYVRWRWEWKLRGKSELRVVPGVTHVRFDRDGRVAYHRDLFDAAGGFFEALPVIGGALRMIKRRL